MKRNPGKVFEQRWKKSCPEYVLAYKLPDTPQAFGNSAFRFTKKNPFDYILWDNKRCVLFALELKSVGGNSISFERNKDDSGLIHLHQINGLSEWSKYGVECGFLIEFRKIEKTVYININDFTDLISSIDKKSINFADLDKCGAKFIEIPQSKMQVNYSYDVESFLSNFGTEVKGE